MTETSPGTDRPARRTARTAPSASTSLAQMTPVTPSRSILVVAAWNLPAQARRAGRPITMKDDALGRKVTLRRPFSSTAMRWLHSAGSAFFAYRLRGVCWRAGGDAYCPLLASRELEGGDRARPADRRGDDAGEVQAVHERVDHALLQASVPGDCQRRADRVAGRRQGGCRERLQRRCG